MLKKLCFSVLMVLSLDPREALCLSHKASPRGFLWYKETPSLPKTPILRDKEISSLNSFPLQAKAAQRRNQERRKKLEAALAIALDRPTLQNALNAQRAQKAVFDHSEKFSKAWVLAALMDAGVFKNINPLHLRLSKHQETLKERESLRSLTRDWGLLFFVQKGCLYCEKFAPILFDFQKETGFQILAVSETGEAYGTFEGQKITQDLERLNPEGIYPLVFMIHKSGRSVYPVARGLTDSDQLKKNILTLSAFHKTRGEGG